QEQLAYEMIANNKPEKYKFNAELAERDFSILSPAPSLMFGLTRRERQLKQLMFMALEQLYHSKSTPEIRYWYTEWRPQKYHDIQKMEFEEIWNCLYEEAKMGWSEKHIMLCE